MPTIDAAQPDPCRSTSSSREHGDDKISEACRTIATGGTFWQRPKRFHKTHMLRTADDFREP
jgi:hypothetical protein